MTISFVYSSFLDEMGIWYGISWKEYNDVIQWIHILICEYLKCNFVSKENI
jgi:hypothetical protein